MANDAAVILEMVQRLQSEFWDAVSKLEGELGIELESTTDFSSYTVESLLEESRDDLDERDEQRLDDGEEQ